MDFVWTSETEMIKWKLTIRSGTKDRNEMSALRDIKTVRRNYINALMTTATQTYSNDGKHVNHKITSLYEA